MRLLALAIVVALVYRVQTQSTDCEYGPWSDCFYPFVDDDGVSCGNGWRNRTGNSFCSPVNQTVACFKECPHLCTMSEFTPWTVCNQSCVMPDQIQGYQYRTRQVIYPAYPHNHKDQCETSWLQQTRKCNLHDCPFDCYAEPWPEVWPACNKTCGGGYQTRTRTVTLVGPVHRPGTNQSCPNKNDTRMCNLTPCPINCNVSDWGDWSECSATCGPSERTRTRFIRTYPQNNGTTCPALIDTESCMTFSCDLEDLRWECKEKDEPTFLVVPEVCPTEVVYCPGGGGVGIIKPCPSGMAFNVYARSCRPESELCTDGMLNPTPAYPPWYPWYRPSYPPPVVPPPVPAQPPAGGPSFLCKQNGQFGATKSGNCGGQYWWCTAGQQAKLENCPPGAPYFKVGSNGFAGSCTSSCP